MMGHFGGFLGTYFGSYRILNILKDPMAMRDDMHYIFIYYFIYLYFISW